MFSGIGGFELAFPPAWECVGFSEVDKYAERIYLSHFPNHYNFGDARHIPTQSLPDFDLLCGGFPCQAFSVAGKRRGFDDTRGTLFFEMCRIAKAKRPRLLLLENVKGLLSHAGGVTFRTILATLDELGYDAEWQVCNSKDFGVPQNRERVFIVGHLRGAPRPEVFPLEQADPPVDADDASTAIDANYWKGIDNHGARTAIVRWSHDKGVVDTQAPSLRASSGGGLRKHPVILQRGRGKNHGGVKATAPTVSSHDYPNNNLLGKGATVRRLTPTECERLQGFPDGWTKGVSDTQRYKSLGNAVTVNVVRAVAARL